MLMAFIGWLLAFKYFLLFILAVIQGPVVPIIAGSLVAGGQLDFWPACITLAIGDVLSDCLYYAVGRFGRFGFINQWGHFIGLSPERIKRIDEHFLRHAGKTLVLGKLAITFEIPFIVAAGLARYSFARFLVYVASVAVPKALIFLAIGYFFGYSLAGTKRDLAHLSHLILIALVTIVAVTIVHIVIVRLSRTHTSPGIRAYIRLYNGVRNIPAMALGKLRSRHSSY